MRPTTLATLLVLGLGCTTTSSDEVAPVAPPPRPSPSPAERGRAGEGAARWVALGDSYTKGEAARADEAWPAVAAARLSAAGRPVELVANLGRTGWTARDVLARQVPRLEELRPDFVTVQVGINDLVQGKTADEFRGALRDLLAALVARTGSPDRVVAVTIPDFSVAAAAPRFGDPKQLHDDIARRNAIIVEEGARASVRVAQIFERSRDAARDGSLLAKDGIHPSAAGYAAWVAEVLPALEAVLERRAARAR